MSNLEADGLGFPGLPARRSMRYRSPFRTSLAAIIPEAADCFIVTLNQNMTGFGWPVMPPDAPNPLQCKGGAADFGDCVAPGAVLAGRRVQVEGRSASWES